MRAARSRRKWIAALAFVAATALAFALGRWGRNSPPQPRFHRLTFRRGTVLSARFVPGDRTVLYGAAWDGGPIRLFATRPEHLESRDLGYPPADILAVSSKAEMALSVGRRLTGWLLTRGALAIAPVAGGEPREILENVHQADWSPDGEELAIAYEADGVCRVEYPLGNVVHEAPGYVSDVRVSPDGERVAFIDHRRAGSDAGVVVVVDRSGAKKELSGSWASAIGLAWAPSGDEIWFTASESGPDRDLYATDMEGRTRIVLRVPGNLTFHDVSSSGDVLVSVDRIRNVLIVNGPDGSGSRDLSYLDASLLTDLSHDGRILLFHESGPGGGSTGAVFWRTTDGSPPARLGDGMWGSLSPDGKWVRARQGDAVVLIPMGAGETRPLAFGGFRSPRCRWLPDSNRLLLWDDRDGGLCGLYVVDLEGGDPIAITEEAGFDPGPVSPDGRYVAVVSTSNRRIHLVRLEGGLPEPIPGSTETLLPLEWHAGGRSLYVLEPRWNARRILLLDVETGETEIWKELDPGDPAGATRIWTVCVTPDGNAYGYTYTRFLSDLYLVEGLK